MLELVAPGPVVDSSVPTVTDPSGSPLVAPSARPEVIGVAPDEPQPQLRREGEFIVSRRGRLMMSAQSGQMLYVFEADSAQAPESPMPIVPCQVLQNMEDLLRDRKDNLVFVVSGQVLLYRGVNYLLPTMMKIAIDRGNLRP